MKEKLKNEKERKINPKSHITLHISNNSGITLVALIITIIVLLILALVAIQAVSENGIIGKAKESQTAYNQAQANEQAILQNYGDYITGKLENNINWEQILADATANPSKYKHPEQQRTNDIGIGTDGKLVNLDLWNYEYQFSGTSGYSLGTGGSMEMAGYKNSNIVNGKIQGTVPMYIKEEGKTNFYPVTMLYAAFAYCTDMTEGPEIPSTVTDMYGAFLSCTSLRNIQEIPYGVTSLYNTFQNCTSLKTVPTIPNSVTNLSMTFYICTNLTTAPVIPSSVTNMRETFSGCTNLTTAPVIPSNVTNMRETFSGCTNLTGELVINSTPTAYDRCLSDAVTGTDCSLVLKGDCPRETLEQIALTGPYLTSPGIYKVTVGK